MELEEIRTFADSLGIPSGELSKTELIKSVQLGEGNFDCYGSASIGECDQLGCNWRADCFEASKSGEAS